MGDVLKIDIGVQVKGRILDSAFTLSFDPTYDKLVEAVKASTDTGVRVSSFVFLLSPTDSNLVLGSWNRYAIR